MSYTDKDLLKLLASNPDLQVIDGNDVLTLTKSASREIAPAPTVKLSERQMQEIIFEECQRRAVENPAYGLLVGIPNGQFRPGQRMEVALRVGFPDFILPIARHSRIGLAIETKISPNKPSESQLFWQRRLRVEGWVHEVVYDDPYAALNLIEWYICK